MLRTNCELQTPAPPYCSPCVLPTAATCRSLRLAQAHHAAARSLTADGQAGGAPDIPITEVPVARKDPTHAEWDKFLA